VVLGFAVVTASQALGSPREAHPAAHIKADRYRAVVDVYVLLLRPDGMILLLERSGTGYADGQLCPTGVRAGSPVVTC
jgi:hypothetical protein